MRSMRLFCTILAAGVLSLVIAPEMGITSTNAGGIALNDGSHEQSPGRPSGSTTANFAYLPLILSTSTKPVRIVNAPYFSDPVENHMSAQALFWFGHVNSTENYADVRMGFNDTELYARVAVIDRRLWYNATNPASGNLTDWDSVSLFLSLDGNTNSAPAHTFRFDAQPNWWEPRAYYAASYRGTGSGWTSAAIPFTTLSSWRGNALNDDIDDTGWVMEYHIPFASLGLTAPPTPSSAAWGLGLAIHNRDDSAGTPLPVQTWPETVNTDSPSTWGQLRFGLPTYRAPAVANPGQLVTIRNGPEITVTDSAVGGRFTCGDWLQFWSQWGNANYAHEEVFNIQNEADISDWPCFSKYYVTFPLASLPTNKVIVSATLTLHQFGQAGAPGAAQYSLIQVSTVAEDWAESTLTWNNAPLALENVGQALVDPAPQPCDWPCIPRTWNVTYAAAQAYATNQPLRLVLYSGDPFYHSGKYFVSSDAEDWNAVARPTLQVLWGDPQ